jgi:hypothetical protein
MIPAKVHPLQIIVDTEEAFYCKALLKTGKPIVVKNLITGDEYTTDCFQRMFFDEWGNRIVIEMKFTGKKLNSSGARCKLVIRRAKEGEVIMNDNNWKRK